MRVKRTPESLADAPVAPAFGLRERRARWWSRVAFGLLVLPLFLASIPVVSQAATIRYVNPTDPACQGHAPCYQTIQAAVDAVQAGDTIRIQAGTYQEQVNISGKNNVAGATEADRILIEADPAAPVGSVVLQGAVAQCTNGYAIRLQQSRYITIRGLSITGAGGQAISLMGGNNQNTAIHLERNRIFGNGGGECNGGVTVARGNPGTVMLNNILYAGGRNGITFIDADGGPHYLIGNTISAHGWSGISVARSHEVWLVNNLVFGNGTQAGSTGGRFGVKREGSTSPQPAGITLLNNLICGNRLGEIDGPALDATDSNNLTPTGSEGPGVSASPGCEVPANVFANLNGLDTQPNTADDDFTLAPTSPVIDRGMDPRTLGLNPSFNTLFEADFSGEGRRPRDGNGSGTAEFDVGALEAGVTARPTITNLNPNTGVHGQTINLLTVTGERLGGATALAFLKDGTPDAAITATNLSVNSEGTQLTATVTIAAAATLGTRVVTVTTSEGTSDATATSGNTFTVLGQITLVPDFMSLVEGQSGGLTVQLSAPAPTGGLTVNLESANTTIATVPASVTVPGGATSTPTNVTAVFEGTTNVTASATGFASGQTVVTVRPPVPSISSFNPSSGKVTTTVVISGTGFRLAPIANTVRFTGPNSTWVAAPVTAASSTSLTVTVPTGAVTGPLQVSTSGGTATSSGHFIVLPTEDFQLSAAPATVSVAASGEGAVQLTLSGSSGFTALTTLGVSGVPPGVTATFGAATLTASQSTFLRLQTSGATPAGDHPLQVTATGPLNGIATTRSASFTLQVQAPGVSSLTGQILTNQDVPIPNVRLILGSVQGTTDAAGNFLLANVPAPPTAQPLSIDANVAVAGFPIYSVDVTLVAGQTTVLPPFRITPPPPQSQFVPISNATAAQVVTDARYPGFSITLPQGVTITGWDGVVKSQIAIERLTPDRLPVPPPPFATRSVYQIFFGTPMGGLPSAPLPVTLPNDQDMQPGDKANIWYYDAAPFPGAPGTWRLAGAGTVSADGSRVVADPGVGIERFCGVCGAICIQRQGERDPNHNPDGTKSGEPVDLATGLFIIDKTDLVLPGRFPIVFHRTYNPIEPFGGIAGFELGLGRGWALSLDVVLLEGSSSLRTLILPGNSRFAFPQQSPGTFVNTTHPRFAGAVLTQTGSTHTLRFKDGAFWRFASGWLAGGFPIPGLSLVTEQTDRTGNRLLFTRDAQGKLLRLTEPTTNRALELSYTGTRISQVQDPLTRRVQYSYDAQGRLETVTDPAGGVTRYTYDGAGRILTITDPRTITYLTNEYSPGSGRILKQTQADGGIWLFKYQLQGATVTGPGCPGPTCPTEESSARVAQGYSFSGGFVVATTVVDPRGNATTTRFTPDGFPREVTDPLGQTTRQERDAAGRLIRTTDPLSRVTQFAYDASGNVTSITDALGNTRSFTYDPTFNKVTSITDPLGNLTTFEYDASGNLIATTDPEQNLKPPAERLKTTFTYNGAGQPLTTTDPLGNTTTFTYDSTGSLAAINDPLGNTTQRTYDLVSRLIAQSDPLGKTTRFSYDALNRLVSTVDALNGQTIFGYDPNGNLLTVTDSRGNTITHEYDNMDRLNRRTDQLGKAETFSYDGNANLVSTTDRKNQTTTFTYDALNRRVRSEFADGAVATFQYDAAARLLQTDDTADPHRPIIMAYDSLDRLLAETTGMGTVNYAYDALGRRTQMTVSGLSPVAYSYDAASRLRTITQAPLNPVDIQYDALGRRTSLALPNGVSTEYIYDLASRLTALIYRNAFGLLGDLTYQYDPAGNRTNVGGSFARTLLPDSVPSAAYDSANRQLTFGNKSMTFDDNGSLTSLTDPSSITAYTWDARNRLVGLSGATTGAFDYDAQGRRARRDIAGESRVYQYDRADIIRERINDQEIDYLGTLGIDEPLSRREPGGALYYLAEALSSTVALVDGGGAIATAYTYEPFGRALTSGAASGNPFQFTARENDSSGFYYYRARYYAHPLARFISPDPLLCGETTAVPLASIRRSPQSLHAFAYLTNSPLSLRDPLGLSPECSYYDMRCAEQQDRFSRWYYCYASKTVCETASRDPWSTCVRECLQDFDRNECIPLFGRKSPWTALCTEIPGHAACFTKCSPPGGPPPLSPYPLR